MTAMAEKRMYQGGTLGSLPSTPTRRISDDVASLDSWTEALSSSSESSISGRAGRSASCQNSEEIRQSGNTGRPRLFSHNVEPIKPHNPKFDRATRLNRGLGSRNREMCEIQTHSKNSVASQYHHFQPQQSVYQAHSPPFLQRHPQFNFTYNYRDSNPPHIHGTTSGHTTRLSSQGHGLASHSQFSHGSGSNRAHHSSNDFGSDRIIEQLDREGEKLKTKLMSAWNNVKYGWTLKTRTTFRVDSPIFLLGRCYHRRPEEHTNLDDVKRPPSVSNLDEFRQDFSSRIWFTYRRDFLPLPGTKFTTDCGWGCMLRSCQMMIAQALIVHFLGQGWRVYSDQRQEQNAFYREIVRWFGDHLSDKSPFSIHKLAEIGQHLGKSPGDWYGPASVSYIFREALIKAGPSIPILDELCIYVAQDCTVYKQDILDVCMTQRVSSQVGSSSELDYTSAVGSDERVWRKALIILIPMRLGGESLNEMYIPCVKSLLANDNCIGIIGGKPKHSLYFIGWQEDKLINLDPHYCQDVVDTTKDTFPIQSFHCVSPRKLAFNKMDPSCCIGFYCKTYKEFKKFVQQVQELVIPPKQRGQYPLFIFSEGRSSDVSAAETPVREQGCVRIQHYRVDQDGRVRSPTMESEDFVIL